MNIDDRLELITRNTQEVITLNELKELLGNTEELKKEMKFKTKPHKS